MLEQFIINTDMFKTFKALPILLMAPLLMANSPAPAPVTKPYHDLSVAIVDSSVDHTRYYQQYSYDFEITNTGKEYACLDRLICLESLENWQYYCYFYFDSEDQIFFNSSVAPGQKVTYTTYIEAPFEIKDNYVFEATCYMYPLSDVEFNNPQIVKYHKEEKTYVFKANIKNDKKINYALFIDVEYKGKPYCFRIFYNETEKTFRTYEELDLNQLEIKGVYAYQERNSSSYNLLDTSTIITISVVSTLLLAGILIPVVIVSEKRRKR